MSIKIKGINTAPIKYGESFYLMTFKIQDFDNTHHIFYVNVEVLIDFLIVLRKRMLKVSKTLAEQGESYRDKLLLSSEALAKNVPTVLPVEVQQPDPRNLIMSLAPKFQDEQFTLIAMMQNEQVASLQIHDSQVEFILLAVQQALKVLDDKETNQMIGSLLDFLLMYTVDLSNLEYLNFRHVSHEPWKQRLFNHHLAILYAFDTEQGEQILAGSIIKANAEPQSDELNNIIQRLTVLTPMLKELQEKHPISHTYCQILPSQPGQILNQDDCLRPLHAYCLETQASRKA